MCTATFIKKPRRLRRIQEGPLGAYLELLSERLSREGHCQQTPRVASCRLDRTVTLQGIKEMTWLGTERSSSSVQ